jgi:hypothetical protein
MVVLQRESTIRASGTIRAKIYGNSRQGIKKGGTPEEAAGMADHASARTTQLYDRRRDQVSLDEVERIVT